tara:strand:+ start:73 stop:252 length:180 start_codon:yes stop_codon:yes gene_type:complete
MTKKYILELTKDELEFVSEAITFCSQTSALGSVQESTHNKVNELLPDDAFDDMIKLMNI